VASIVEVEKVELSKVDELGVSDEDDAPVPDDRVVSELSVTDVIDAAPPVVLVAVDSRDISLDLVRKPRSKFRVVEVVSLAEGRAVEVPAVPACLASLAGRAQRRGRTPRGPASAAATSDRAYSISVEVRISPVPVRRP
jgi:hypothetical protein